MPQKALSTKWWNVIRRELRATPVTYEGDPPPCPDCGAETHLMNGKYGRFYRCEYYDCMGTWGARIDGTPRVSRVAPELRAVQERVRDIVHEVLIEMERQPQIPSEFTFAEYVDVGTTLKTILKRARVWEEPGWLLHHGDSPKGLFLRKRNLNELARIEAAAKEELRLLRWTPYWDRLISDENCLGGT